MLDFYRRMSLSERVIFWVVLFFTVYMLWQIAVRPFWNDPA